MKYQKRALQIQALMGFKPMTKYFPASEIAKKKAYKILKERAYGMSKRRASNILAFNGIQTHDFYKKYIFQLMKYQKRNPYKFIVSWDSNPMSAIRLLSRLIKYQNRKPSKKRL